MEAVGVTHRVELGSSMGLLFLIYRVLQNPRVSGVSDFYFDTVSNHKRISYIDP